jgi:hypothetical protein
MAKLALKLREQKRRKTVEKFKVRRQTLQELLQAPRLRRGQGGGAREAAEAAARRFARAAAQPPRAHRSPTRRVSQIRLGRIKLRGARTARRSARRHQGELVGGLHGDD